MEFKDYYDILGIAPDADAKSIKKAYRKKARQYHPDVSKHHNAEEKFKEASEALQCWQLQPRHRPLSQDQDILQSNPRSSIQPTFMIRSKTDAA